MAITLASSSAGNAGVSFGVSSYNYTVSGTLPCLVLAGNGTSPAILSAVRNGQNFTLGNRSGTASIWYLLNPTAGNYNTTITWSSDGIANNAMALYNEVGSVGANAGGSVGSGSPTTISQALTTLYANSWITAVGGTDNFCNFTAGANTTLGAVANYTGAPYHDISMALADSGVIASPSSVTLNWNLDTASTSVCACLLELSELEVASFTPRMMII